MTSRLAAESLTPYMKPLTTMAICRTAPERVKPSVAEQAADTSSTAAISWCGGMSISIRPRCCWMLEAYQPQSTVPASLASRFCMTAPPSTACDRPVLRSKYSSDGPNAPHMPPLTTITRQ